MPKRRQPGFSEPLRTPSRASRKTRATIDGANRVIAPIAEALAKAKAMIAADPIEPHILAIFAKAPSSRLAQQLPLDLHLVDMIADKPRLARPHAKARERETKVLKMTLKGRKVREIAAALRIREESVLRIRARLRHQGRLTIPPRIVGRREE